MRKPLCATLVLLAALAVRAETQPREVDFAVRSLMGPRARAGEHYVALIAVGAYKEWKGLKDAVREAKELREVLSSRYYVDQVLELYDEKATGAGIEKLLESMAARAKPDDSVLVYFAGRGFVDEKDGGFWLPADAGADKKARKNWLSNARVRDALRAIKARRVALVSDSSFSPSMVDLPKSGPAVSPAAPAEAAAKAWQGVSRQVLALGPEESPEIQSEFARQLNQALKGNAAPRIDIAGLAEKIKLGSKRAPPLLGCLKDSGHEPGASLLLFLKAGTGTLSFDWLPPRAGVRANGLAVPVSRSKDARAFTAKLPAGAYELSIALPGLGTYRDKVEVRANANKKLEKLTAFELDALSAKKRLRRSLDAAGWISLGLGVAGAAGAGATYYLGGRAMDEYRAASASSDAASARARAESYGALFAAAAAVGGTGLGLAPVLWLGGPSGKTLAANERELDAQIKALKK